MSFDPILHDRSIHMAKPSWFGTRRLTLTNTLTLERSDTEVSTGSSTYEFLRVALLLKQQDVGEAATKRESETESRTVS